MGMISIRNLVQDMRPLEALEYVLEAYEQIAGDEVRHAELCTLGLAPQQAAIYAALEARPGRVVYVERLLSLLSNAAMTPVSRDTLRVQISRLRSKTVNWPFEIVTVRSIGYQLQPRICNELERVPLPQKTYRDRVRLSGRWGQDRGVQRSRVLHGTTGA